MKCDMCGAEVRDVTAAIEAGWCPSYYESPEDDGEVMEPICGECSTARCYVDDGELVLKPVAIQPREIMSYGWDNAIHDHRLR